jgi:hypothetical protein
VSAKNKAAIVAAAASVAFAGMSMVEPHLPNQPAKTPGQIQQEQRDRSNEDLSDADEKQKDRYRDEGGDLLNANERDKLRPGEYRAPEPPRFRFLPR